MALTRPKYSQIYDTDYKNSVRVATTADVGNLLATGNMINSIDGVSLAVNDRILVKNQSTGAQNGIYYVSVLGTGSNGTWVRSQDADGGGDNKVTAGLTTVVSEGSQNAGKEFRLITPDPITVGVTSLTFQGITSYPGGANLQVQFNDGGILGGASSFTFDKTTGNLTVANLTVTGYTSLLTEYVVGNITATNVIANGAIIGTSFSGNGRGLANTGPSYTSSTSAPAGPSVQDLWYDTATDILFMYEDDGTSKHWVDITSITPQAFSTNTSVNFTNISVQYTTTTTNLAVTSPEQATSSTTGGLVVAKGAGIGGNLYVGGNVNITGNLLISSNSYIQGSRILTGADLETVTYLATSISVDPSYGTYQGGDINSIQTLGDYASGYSGYFSIKDTATSPAWIVYIGFTNIIDFNKFVLSFNYTANSGHTVEVDVYNNQTSSWDTLATTSGTTGYFQFNLGVIDSAPYITGGSVSTRVYHVSTGNTAHEIKIDYAALEKSVTGGQGPRGPTGATGSQGITTGTSSVFYANATNNSTSTSTGALIVTGGVGIGGALFVGSNISATTLGNVGSFITGSTGAFGNISGNLIGNTGAYLTGQYGLLNNLLAGTVNAVTIGNTGSTGQFNTVVAGAVNAGTIGNASASGTFNIIQASIIQAGNILVSTTGNIQIANTYPSTSNISGALTVAGGVGISGNVNIDGVNGAGTLSIGGYGVRTLATNNLNQATTSMLSIQNSSDVAYTGSTRSYFYALSATPSVTNSGAGGSQFIDVAGAYFSPRITSSGTASRIQLWGSQSYAYRSNAADTSTYTSNYLTGLSASHGHLSGLSATAVTGTSQGVNSTSYHQIGTITNITGVNSAGLIFPAAGNTATATNYTAFGSPTTYIGISGGGTVNITNAHGVNIGGPTIEAGATVGTYYGLKLGAIPTVLGTLTNRYGIYQEDSSSLNYLAGNLTIANTAISTSTTTGALIVSGGVGIGGTVWAPTVNATIVQAVTFGNTGAFLTGGTSVIGNISTALLAAVTVGNTGAFITGSTSAFGNVTAAVIGNASAFLTGGTSVIGNISTALLAAVTVGNTGAFLTGSTAAFGNISAVTIGNTGSTGQFNTVNAGQVSAVTIGNTGSTGQFNTVNAGQVSAVTIGNIGATVNADTVNSYIVKAVTLGNTASFHTGSTATFGNIAAVNFGNVGATATFNLIQAGNILISTTGNIQIANIAPTTSATTGALTVAGGVGIGGNLWVDGDITLNGNLIMLGNTNIVNTNNIAISDSIIDLHTPPDLSALTVDDGRDVGLHIHYYKTQDSHAFLGWNNTSTYLEWYGSGNEGVNGKFTGEYGTFKTGNIKVVSTAADAASTSSTSGALQILGGVGVGGSLFTAGTISGSFLTGSTSVIGNISTGLLAAPFIGNIGTTINGGNIIVGPTGNIVVNNTQPSTSYTTGAVQILGGVGIAGNLQIQGNVFHYPGGNVIIANTASATTATSGALQVAGGIGVQGSVHSGGGINSPTIGNIGTTIIGGNILIGTTGNIQVANTYPSISYLTGAVVIAGGTGIGGNLQIQGNTFHYPGGNVQIANTAAATTATSGALQVSGGIGVQGSIHSGGGINSPTIGNIGTTIIGGNILIGTTGNIQVANTYPSTSYTSGAVTLAGGMGVGGNLQIQGNTFHYPGGNVIISNIAAATTATSGALQVAGGIGVQGSIHSGGGINSPTIGNIGTTIVGGNILIGTTGNIQVANTYPSISYLTGAVVIAGGTGIAGNLQIQGNTFHYPGGNVVISNTAAATTATSGALQVVGGVGVGGSIHSGGGINSPTIGNIGTTIVGGNILIGTTGNIQVANTYPSGTYTSGAVIIAGGTGIGGNLQLQGNLFVYPGGNVQIANTASATTATSGALQVAGGIGVQGSIFSGGSINAPFIGNIGTTINGGNIIVGPTGNIVVNNTQPSTSYTTGAVQIAGGVGIAGNLQLQANLFVYPGGNVIIANTAGSSSNVTGAVVVRGGLGVAGNAYVGQRVGYVWGANNVSAVYQVFNQVTGTLDTVFG